MSYRTKEEQIESYISLTRFQDSHYFGTGSSCKVVLVMVLIRFL